MSLSLSPFVVVHTPTEAQLLVELATRSNVQIHHQYRNPNGLDQRLGGWYWYTHAEGSKDNAIYFYGDTVTNMVYALTASGKVPTPTNSIPHFIASCRRLSVDCGVPA